MKTKKTGRRVFLAWIWLVILALTLIAATYAWFTFNPYTNVTPMSSTVSQGGANLLISNSPQGEFDVTCTLVLEGDAGKLSPVSTADLSGFYVASAQNRKGISILFADASDRVDQNTMHGKVYLKNENGACNVYFYRSGLKLGGDDQTLAALRLGLKISTAAGTQDYILRLDDLGNTGAAGAVQTVPVSGTVISSVDGSGSASFVQDPSAPIGSYMARESGNEDPEPGPGDAALCRLQAEEIAVVEYWLYLEGCDDNCMGDVQSKDMDLQLAFAGVEVQ